ncbi:type II restriction endonuclease [Brochothrix thermosphacta]|uniref:type II restriction endonuclease n=1 Tax=Brochothrix thermosphacta TaxID=2756 RepID=UPI00083F7BFF|nr:type II restriction endonuclease [Brochothrix thermosphacta]ODJ71498.1 hypothetical protein BFR39_05215 [Brochothrix thermosphacta]
MDFKNAVYSKFGNDDRTWGVKGLINERKQIFTLGSDSKLIGRIFELITGGFLNEIAEENGYELVPSISQTVYPDFNLVKKDNNNKIIDIIAVDVKTTYRRYTKTKNISKHSFTLGSFASFMRNNTKNIQFPYDSYSKHYIIGFIYDRAEYAVESIIDFSNLDKVESPYYNVEYFVEEKYKIAGDKPGSGNTENIGSFKSNSGEKYRAGKGPFSILGEEVFNDYWINYPKYREINKKYTDLPSYFEWLEKNGKDSYSLLEKYKEWDNN